MWPTIRFDVIGEAWRLYRRHWGVWSLAMLIVMIGNSLVSGAVFALFDAGRPGGHGGFRLPPSPGGSALQYILWVTISGFFVGGMIRMASSQIRGRAPRIEDLFSVTDVWFDLLLGSFLYGLVTFLGSLFCVIPGLIASGLLMFTIPLIVEARLPATGAMIESWNALKSQWLTATFFHVILSLLSVSGALLCCFGLVLTGPLYSLSIAILYHDFFPPSPFKAWDKRGEPFPEI